MGFHAFWTVEHHFLEEYSHCSNPEVLYGAVAARTKNIRIGYGVRLLPKPYNHPIRTAESVAVLDLALRRPRRLRHRPLVDARRARGLRHRSRRDARDVARGARAHRRRVDRGRVPGRRQVLADGRAAPGAARSRCSSRTRRSSARRAACPATRRSGSSGIGLCSFTVGLPPEELAEQHRDVPQGPRRVRRSPPASSSTTPRRRSRWCTARRPTRRPPRSPRSRSSGTRSTAAGSSRRSPSGMEERGSRTLGTYQYTGEMLQHEA